MSIQSFLKKVANKLSGKPSVYIDENKYIIAKYIGKNPVILEAGACDGRDTLQMLSHWKHATIYAFEPVPELFETVNEKVKGYKNVVLSSKALGDKSGKTKMFVSSGTSDGSSSLLKPLKHLEVHPSVKFENEIDIESITLDEWSNLTGVKQLDLMWLDLQGNEFNVLKSGIELLSNTKAIFTEVSLIETYQGVVVYPEFKKWLSQFGFSVVWEDLPYNDMGNVLFVKK